MDGIALVGIVLSIVFGIVAMAFPFAYPNMSLLIWRLLFWGGLILFILGVIWLLYLIFHSVPLVLMVVGVLIFIVGAILYWTRPDYLQGPSKPIDHVTKPSLKIQIMDNLFNADEIKKSGQVVYYGLITLPISEKMYVSNIFVEVDFPLIIENFELTKIIGIENPKIQLGPNEIIELDVKKGFKTKTRSLILESNKITPGAHFEFTAYSVHLPNRNVKRDIDYSGYYYWKSGSEEKKEEIKGKSTPHFKQIASIDLEKTSKYLKQISEINSKEGTYGFWVSKQSWLEKNNSFIEMVPLIKKDEFSLRVVRDIDNILKCTMNTYYYKNVVLQFKDLEKLKNKPGHPRLMIALTWNEERNVLYVDGEIADSYPKITH
jgi:hypothetical protein